MIRDSIRAFYGFVTIRFESELPIEQAVAQLKAITIGNFKGLVNEGLMGNVSLEYVSLERNDLVFSAGKFWRNKFIGSFEKNTNGCVLCGKFTCSLPWKIIITLWLIFSTLLTVFWTFNALLQNQKDSWQGALNSFGFFVFGFSSILFWEGSFQYDCEWLSSIIQKALRKPG